MTRINRRRFLQSSGVLAAGLPLWARQAAAAGSGADDRILVVVELSGGNDGLNCVVPHGDDAYYRARPALGIPAERLLKLDDHFGLNPGMLGFQRLWENGRLAIVHGCGYDNPSFSHFTSMAYWHTAAPHSGSEYGWVGRLADQLEPEPVTNYIVNVDARQSLAVRSRVHTPVVFDDPARFQRRGFSAQTSMLRAVPQGSDADNDARAYLNRVARSGRDASVLIRDAWSAYSSPVDYGIVPIDLPKVAACIAADLPARLYYVAFRNNAFDTHVAQADLHTRLLSYACDAIHGFLADMERLGLSDRVLVMAFSEFGRRVPENANLGTDHGAAGPMFLAGGAVTGGHYGDLPSLTLLDEGDNLIATTDFRRVYATAMDGWLSPGISSRVLGGEFPALPVFG
jgi:uncharacterized protein (DUF1501 family)